MLFKKITFPRKYLGNQYFSSKMGVPYYDDELLVPRVNESPKYYPSLMMLCDYQKNRTDLILLRQLWDCKNQYEKIFAVRKYL